MAGYKEESQKKRNYMLIPIFFIVVLLPLVVRLAVYENHLSGFDWFSKETHKADFFLYYKQIAFIVVSGLMLCMMLVKIFMGECKIRKHITLIPLGVYMLFALLSSIFSDYKQFSFSGIYEQFESVWVLLGYGLAVFYVFHMVDTELDIKSIVKYLTIGIVLSCIIGTFQLIGHDILFSNVGLHIVTAPKYWNSLGNMEFNFEKTRVFMGLYNPNYVGLYGALVAPITIIGFLFHKNTKYKIGYGVLFIALMLCIFGAQSRNGLLAVAIAVFFLIIFLRKFLLKLWKPLIGGIVVLTVGFVIVNAVNNNAYLENIKNLFTVKTPDRILQGIDTNQDNLEITYRGEKLFIDYKVSENEDYTFNLQDGNNNVVDSAYNDEQGLYTISDPRFATIQLKPILIGSDEAGQSYSFGAIIDGVSWFFTNQLEDQAYHYYTPYGKWSTIATAPGVVFNNYETFGSSRGYIWSKTIPLMKDTLILGTGADTFSLVYPQNDTIGLMNNNFGSFEPLGNGEGQQFVSTLMTKPHNMYLQIGVQTGIISLLAFLCFYGMYFVSSVRIYWKTAFDSYLSQIGIGVFVGTIGYMASGFVNDSTITVSPIFWVLMGTGLAINQLIKKQKG